MRGFSNRFDAFFEPRFAPITVEGKEYPAVLATMNPAGEIMGVVSNRYELVPNSMVATLSDKAFGNLPITQQYDHVSNNGAKWKRHMVIDKSAINFHIGGMNDSMGIMIELVNSYNGKIGWGMNIMGFRSICSNGMVFGKQNLFSTVFRHTADAVDRMKARFEVGLDGVENVVETFTDWTHVPFSAGDMRTYMLNHKASDKTAETVVNTFENRVYTEKSGYTKWSAYNALTYIATHETKSKGGNNPMFSTSTKRFFDLANGFFDKNITALPM